MSRSIRASQHDKQRGGSLIVVLVLMSAMTILALSAIYDSGTQFRMVRNDQFSTNTYLAAYSEINAQLDRINLNATTDADSIIIDLLRSDIDQPLEVPPSDFLGPHAGAGAFEQGVEYVMTCNPDTCPSPPGFSMSMITRTLRGDLRSQAELVNGGGILSDQSQSFWYLLPQNPLYVFD